MCSWDTGEWNSLNCFVTLCCFRFLALGTNLFNYSALRQALVQVLSSFLSFAFRTVLSSQAFPRVVACEMEVFGVSGSITKASGICTLPINVVNEKIYLVLWLTFVLASLLSLVQVLHQALLVAPSLRPYIVPHLSPSPLVSRQVIGLPLVHISSPMITRYSCLTIQATRLMRRGSYGNMVECHILFLTDKYLSSDYILPALEKIEWNGFTGAAATDCFKLWFFPILHLGSPSCSWAAAGALVKNCIYCGI